MFFRKNKIKEKTKHGLYGNKYNSGKNVSGWENLSIIEKFCLIFLPILLCYMVYIMLDMTGMIWWLRLIISIGMVSGLIGLITLIINYFHEM